MTSQANPNASNAGSLNKITLDCPAGLKAINGGILAAVPARGPDPGYVIATPGGAYEQFGDELSTDGTQGVALPRVENNGSSWRIEYLAFTATEGNGLVANELPITVTFFVICE